MRILFLDDDQERWELFRAHADDRYVSAEVHWARSVEEAFDLLKSEPFDLATLDHDLGHPRYNGQDVARHIANMPEDRRPRTVIIHSWNPPGAMVMAMLLRDAGIEAEYKPFSLGGNEGVARCCLHDYWQE